MPLMHKMKVHGVSGRGKPWGVCDGCVVYAGVLLGVILMGGLAAYVPWSSSGLQKFVA